MSWSWNSLRGLVTKRSACCCIVSSLMDSVPTVGTSTSKDRCPKCVARIGHRRRPAGQRRPGRIANRKGDVDRFVAQDQDLVVSPQSEGAKELFHVRVKCAPAYPSVTNRRKLDVHIELQASRLGGEADDLPHFVFAEFGPDQPATRQFFVVASLICA